MSPEDRRGDRCAWLGCAGGGAVDLLGRPGVLVVVHLRFVEELTQAEIADRVGLTQSQVSRTVQRILDRLRDWLTDEEPAPRSGRVAHVPGRPGTPADD